MVPTQGIVDPTFHPERPSRESRPLSPFQSVVLGVYFKQLLCCRCVNGRTWEGTGRSSISIKEERP